MVHCWRLAVCQVPFPFPKRSKDQPYRALVPGADNTVKIWSPFTGELIRNLNGHTKGNSDVSWSPDSVYLVSASDDTTVRVWDVDSVRALLISLSSILTHFNI